jgi:ribose transport system substrate-binding protein
MRTTRSVIGLAASLAVLLAACAAPPAPPAAPEATTAPVAPAEATSAPAAVAPTDPKDMKILVSMKGPGGGNPFWAAVEKGAVDKAAELGVQLTVLAPPAESDVQAQIAQVEDQVAKGVHAIAIAPTDPAAFRPVLERAQAQGVKVLFIDTMGDLPGATFIGTNNEAGAKLGVDYLCQNLTAGAKVAILQGIVTQSTGKARADGAKAGLTDCGMDIVAELTAEWDTAKAVAVTEDILARNPDIQGLFASNDNMALGAVQALKNAGLNDEVIVVGFDANPDAAAAILAGDMEATVAQNPANMGALGIENAIKLINGETIPENIDTGTELVTKDNAANYQ